MLKLFGKITFLGIIKITCITMLMLLIFFVYFLPDSDPKDTSKEDRVEFFSASPAKCRAYADFRTDSLFLEIDTLKYELKNANIKLDSIITLLNKQ